MKVSTSIGNITQIAVRLHSDLQSVTADQHHAQQHALSAAADHTGQVTEAQLPTDGGIIKTGTYTGNGSANQAVAHGLGRTPKLVLIFVGGLHFFIAPVYGAIIICEGGPTTNGLAVTAPTSTNFYVGNATSYPQSANTNATGYAFIAFG
jgi:hypothetical protein